MADRDKGSGHGIAVAAAQADDDLEQVHVKREFVERERVSVYVRDLVSGHNKWGGQGIGIFHFRTYPMYPTRNSLYQYSSTQSDEPLFKLI